MNGSTGRDGAVTVSELGPSGWRTVTIDRAAKGRAAHELMRQCLASRPGRRRLTVIAVLAALSVPLFSSWLLGLGFGITLAVLQVGWWRLRIARSLRRGYDVGQTITVGYLESEELTVIDQTGQVMLPRGAAMMVLRRGGVVTVFGRSISFVLPSELVTDTDVAFLEGHGEVPHTATTPAPPLPLALEVTPAVQEALVAAKTRVITRSADFLLVPLVTTPAVVFFAAFAQSWRFMVGALVFCLACQIPQLLWLSRSRRSVRTVFPVGFTVRAEVAAQHLALANPHRTVLLPWSTYQAHRLTTRVVLLRRERGKPGMTQVLPRALFSDDALARLVTAVPRTF